MPKLFKYILFFIIFLLIPSTVRFDTFIQKKPFDINLFFKIQQTNPEYVFIGNSMLNTRIDIEHLNKLSNKKSFMFDFSGSLSAEWYLMVKNFVLKLEKKPKIIFIFFRDQNLTFADSNYEINKLMRQTLWHKKKKEYKLEEIIFSNRDLEVKIKTYLEKIYPIIQFRGKIDDELSIFLLKLVNKIFGAGLKRDVINQRFDFNNLIIDKNTNNDNDKGKTLITKKKDFDDEVNLSFLPEIIQIAKNLEIQINLIRVQDTAPALPYYKKHNAREKVYLNKLSKYCSEIDVCNLIDFTGHPLITTEMYSSKSHIKENYMKKYTEIFFNELLLKNLL